MENFIESFASLRQHETSMPIRTIVIDAGHGGDDVGAVNHGRMEKVDNLNLALAVQRRLQAQGQRVIMTRSTDVFISLAERSNISNRNNAELFVSLHRDAFNNPNANGITNFVHTNASQTTVRYAQTVLDEIVRIGVQNNRGVKRENFAVLRNTNAPSMLLEMGFITNARDNQLFDQHFDAYADAITKGIMIALGLSYQPPTIPPSEIWPPYPGVILSRGMQGPSIRQVQERLNVLGTNPRLTEDGAFGPLTEASVMSFQRQRGLNPNGIVGQLTWNALFGAIPPIQPPPEVWPPYPGLILRRGMQGSSIRQVQERLNVLGTNPRLTADGTFGPLTEAAVIAFQRQRGLNLDGIVGPMTWNALFGAIS